MTARKVEAWAVVNGAGDFKEFATLRVKDDLRTVEPDERIARLVEHDPAEAHVLRLVKALAKFNFAVDSTPRGMALAALLAAEAALGGKR